MVLHYFGTNMSQCVQANMYFPNVNCCPSNPPCNKAEWPDVSFKDYLEFQKTPSQALPLVELESQIAIKHNPVVFSWKYVRSANRGHMMVAVGYKTVESTVYISVLNPLPVKVGAHEIITYDDYVSVPADHTHWIDYYDFGRKP
jgi:hypothetical protein